eukprot:TRINITY_DN83610_c0_g1_i1.p1 TRINITY_DN83610_c0_g1~~TRINITY_DN83610_c0_g1_i1.p1  ORF type:complete len:325 (+),score=52.17 TRINITY_DN83610_c0_g1_i1:25-999(+)
MTVTWQQMLRRGLARFCDPVGTSTINGVLVERLRPCCPALFLSGATPGPFYHSHPHVPAEFDHLDFRMAAQVRANLTTIHKIGKAVRDHSEELQFEVGTDWLKCPHLLHWVSGNGEGYEANRHVVNEVSPAVCAELGMGQAETLGVVEVGDNVSDRRFLLETFGMFALAGQSYGRSVATTGRSLRIDIKEEFSPIYFMPYVPGYLVYGPADLAIFSLKAASDDCRSKVPTDGEAQVSMLFDKLIQVLGNLDATFEDVIVGWARVPFLDQDEEAVLMTRSKKGLHRPLAESVLGLAPSDKLGQAYDGTPWRIEYVVLAQVPLRGH